MNKYIFIFILFTLGHFASTAQKKKHNYIYIVTEIDIPVPDVNAIIYDSHSPSGRLAVSDFSGRIPCGNIFPFKIKIFHFGYDSLVQQIENCFQKIVLKPSSNELGGVVITGQSGNRNIANAPQKITIIDRKKIEQIAAVNLKDLLISELNMRISNDAFLGSALNFRGLSGQNLKILIDGVPITGRINGNLDLSQIQLSNVERIEIIEGPMSIVYGTDALAGVINIITKKVPVKKWSNSGNIYYESVGKYNGDIRFGWNGKRVNIGANMGRYFFSGWDTLPHSRMKWWKPKTQYFGGITANFKLKGNTLLSCQSDIYYEKLSALGLVYITPYDAYSLDQYYYTRRFIHSLHLNKKWSNNHTLQLLFSVQTFNRNKITYRKNHINMERNIVPGREELDTTYMINYMSRGIYGSVNEKKKWQWQSGYEFNLDKAKGDKLVNGKQSLFEFDVFASVEYKPSDKFVYKAGMRTGYNSQFGFLWIPVKNSANINNTQILLPFIPALNLKYNINRNHVLRTAYSYGYRSPSLKEMYLEFVDINHNIHGNPELKREAGHSLSMDGEYKNKSKYFIQYSGYYNALRDMISLVVTDPLANYYTYKNIHRASNAGTSVSISKKYYNTSFTAGFSYIYSESKTDNSIITGNAWESNLRINGMIKKIKTEYNLFMKYNSRQFMFAMDEMGGKLIKYNMGGYFWGDFTVSRKWFQSKLLVITGFKNICNIVGVRSNMASGIAHSGGSSTSPVGYGRTFFISLQWKV